MNHYYQNALVVIAAVGVTENGGFIRESHRPPFNQLIRLPYQAQGSRKGRFYVSKRETKSDLSYLIEVTQSELITRGWVIQEWLLSCRIIYYTPNQVYMECRSQAARSISNDVIDKIPNFAEAIPHKPNRTMPSRSPDTYSWNFGLQFRVDSMSLFQEGGTGHEI
jgi:hypothetical protein